MKKNKTKITKAILDKAFKCESADELMAMAKAEGYEITKDEAEAYMAEMDNMELDNAALDNVAGGYCHRTTPCTEVFQ